MSSISHIIHFKSISAFSYLRTIDKEKLLKLIVGIFVLVCFFTGAMVFFHRVFSYLANLKDIGYLLINKIISLGFLAIFIMLIISNLVTSISTLYRSKETSFLFSTPVSHFDVFVVKFFDNILFSTWAVLLLALPLIIAYGIVREFPLWAYLFELFCVLLPFVVIPATIGVSMSMILFLLSKFISIRALISLGFSVLALGLVIYFKFGQPASLAINTIADWRVLNNFLGSMGATSFPYLPNVWVAESLKLISSSSGNKLLIYNLALISTSLMLTSALFRFGNKLYYKSYLSSIAYGGRTAKRNVETRPARPFFELPKWLPSDFRAVLSKDHKLFLREPSQWAQFSVLLALLLIYLLNLKYFPTDVSDSFWKTIIGFGNFAFSGFILATLSVRFVYPTLSLEGKAFWAILSSPMPLKRVFWEKFWSAFLIFLLISELLAFVSNIMLNIHGIIMILTFFSVLLMSASLTSLSIGLGAMFPQFDEKNPGKIASSVGGMLTTVISLIYVGLVVAIAALPAHRYSMHVLDKSLPFPQFEVILAIILTVSLNLIVIFLPLRLGLSSMRKRDY